MEIPHQFPPPTLSAGKGDAANLTLPFIAFWPVFRYALSLGKKIIAKNKVQAQTTTWPTIA